jgi:metallophosphoesterase superfamily enzyme
MTDPAGVHEQLRGWRRKRPELQVELVRGNHDRRANPIPTDLSITVHEQPVETEGILFAHEPTQDAPLPLICGHIHPAATLRDFDGHGVRVPCFVVEPRLMILPAFGGFTGSCTIAPAKERRLYIAAHGRVLPTDSVEAAVAAN